MGPSWTTWTFVMERFCGRLLSAVQSKLHPWGSLNTRVIRIARLNALRVKYSSIPQILGEDQSAGDLSLREFKVPECE